jgi:hypothetical protein
LVGLCRSNFALLCRCEAYNLFSVSREKTAFDSSKSSLYATYAAKLRTRKVRYRPLRLARLFLADGLLADDGSVIVNMDRSIE